MKYIEKILFIHDTQIKRWGKIIGYFGNSVGLILLVISPFLYLLGLSEFNELKTKFVDLGNQVDPSLGARLGESITHLEGALFGVIILVIAASVLIISNSLLTLKLHKRIKELDT